jgi:Zn-dependent peptidase ImmA (M78 family)
MPSRTDQALREAFSRAMQTRRSHGYSRSDPVNAFDIATRCGLAIIFRDEKSLEGMYLRAPAPMIFLPSCRHRPRGRIVFSCAHELGHHVLGHGTHADKYVAQYGTNLRHRTLEEDVADLFAATLLMPRDAVRLALERHRASADSLTAREAYVLATALDVGYTSLLFQMSQRLGLLEPSVADRLARRKVKDIKCEIAGSPIQPRLLPIECVWNGRIVELEVDELAIVGNGISDAALPLCADEGSTPAGRMWKATTPGIRRTTINDCDVEVRVARHGYTGLNRYRHLEEAEDGND